MAFLDLIFPKRCVGCGALGSYVCASCFSFISFAEHGFCTVCQKASINGLTHPRCKTKNELDGVFASVLYKGAVKRLIARFKYSPYVSDLKHVLSDLFYEGLIQNEIFTSLLSNKCMYLPIPLHSMRLRERGFNQSKLLLEGLVKHFRSAGNYAVSSEENNFVMSEMLIRTRHTKRQYGLTQAERLKNIKDAFEIRDKENNMSMKDITVFLTDDIVTTGATMREAARVFKKAGYERVYGIALAHG